MDSVQRAQCDSLKRLSSIAVSTTTKPCITTRCGSVNHKLHTVIQNGGKISFAIFRRVDVEIVICSRHLDPISKWLRTVQ